MNNNITSASYIAQLNYLQAQARLLGNDELVQQIEAMKRQ